MGLRRNGGGFCYMGSLSRRGIALGYSAMAGGVEGAQIHSRYLAYIAGSARPESTYRRKLEAITWWDLIEEGRQTAQA